MNADRKEVVHQSSLSRRAVVVALVLAAIYLIIALPLVHKQSIDIYDTRDEANFHYPTVIEFRNDFPALDLINYGSPTTPLYHIVVALAGLVMGPDIVRLRYINLAVSLLCVLVVFNFWWKKGDIAKASLLVAIFALSPYFLGPAIRLATDNAALIAVFLTYIVLQTSTLTKSTAIIANLLILVTILTRQIYAWLIPAYVVYAWLQSAMKLNRSFIRLTLPVVIPVVGLSVFLSLWGGLTTPHLPSHTATSLNWDSPIFVIALLGLYGTFFAPWFYQALPNFSQWRMLIVVAFLFTVICFLIHPVSNEYTELIRGGALWLVVSRLPTVFSTSIVLWFLFPLGLVYSYILLKDSVSRDDYVLVLFYLFCLLSSIINSRTYQKYYEPFLLFLLGDFVLRFSGQRKWIYWVGPTFLLVGFLVITYDRFFR